MKNSQNNGVSRRSFLSMTSLVSTVIFVNPLNKTTAFFNSLCDIVKTSARLIKYKGREIYQIMGRRYFPMLYSAIYAPVRSPFSELGKENYTHFKEAGINLNEMSVYLDTVWGKDNTLDRVAVNDNLIKGMKGIMGINPRAFIQVRIQLSIPPWWLKQNMHEAVGYADGPIDINEGDEINRALRPSFASEKWKNAASEMLKTLLSYLQSTPEGDRVFSFLICAGVYNEWHYYGFPHEPDTGGAMTDHFRLWLLKKYTTDSGLQKAWNNSEATLASASPPDMKEREVHVAGIFRDPERERKIIDYFQCQHEIVADNIYHFTRLVKDVWPREVLTGIFNGYYFFHEGGFNTGGHLELERILDCPTIDFLAAPFNYYKSAREVGGTGQPRGLPTSVRINKKLYMTEQDNPTSLPSNFPGGGGHYSIENIKESIAGMRTDFSQAVARATGFWMFDFGKIGFWNDPALMKEVAQEHQIADQLMEVIFKGSSDVLFVCDMKTFFYIAETHNEQSQEMIKASSSWMTNDAYHSGAVFDCILLSDMKRVDIDQYKVIIFANTYLMSDQQLDFIHDKVARNGRTLIWNYAPAYTDGKILDFNRIGKATGIKVKPVSLKAPPEIITSDLSITFGLATDGGAGEVPVTPLFAVDDFSVEVLGKYKGTDFTAIGRKEIGDSTSIFVGLPMRNPDFIRNLFQHAGAHIFNHDGDTLFAGGGIITIASTKEGGGNREITLRNGKYYSFELPPAATIIMDSETGEILLGV